MAPPSDPSLSAPIIPTDHSTFSSDNTYCIITIPTTMSFFERIAARSESINSLLCVGLDPHSSELEPFYRQRPSSTSSSPRDDDEEERAEAAYRFCARIIDATYPHAVCYKPNAAFFEALGYRHGMSTLRRVIERISTHDGGNIPVLLDVKRGDIGTTAEAYADACYDDPSGRGGGLGADGVTLSPLMGWDSVKPFITGELRGLWNCRCVFFFSRAMHCLVYFRHALSPSSTPVDDYRHIFATLDFEPGSSMTTMHIITKIYETRDREIEKERKPSRCLHSFFRILFSSPKFPPSSSHIEHDTGKYSDRGAFVLCKTSNPILFSSPKFPPSSSHIEHDTGKYSDRGAFVLCKTSNPGSNDILALPLRGNEDTALFERIARLADEWSRRAEIESPSPSSSSSPVPPPRLGLVVGATDPDALSKARRATGDNTWILAPGVGAQGGDLDDACRAGLNDGGTCLLVPVSRGVSSASDPGEEARRLKDGINEARAAVVSVRRERRRVADAEAAAIDAGDAVRMAPYQREFLKFSLGEGVLKFGSFVLKSGRTSPYFFNAGLFSSGSALHKLGRSYAAAIMDSEL